MISLLYTFNLDGFLKGTHRCLMCLRVGNIVVMQEQVQFKKLYILFLCFVEHGTQVFMCLVVALPLNYVVGPGLVFLRVT